MSTIGVDESIKRAEEKQQALKEEQAHKKGAELHETIQKDPKKAGSPKDSGYENMSSGEMEAFKKGYRGQ